MVGVLLVCLVAAEGASHARLRRSAKIFCFECRQRKSTYVNHVQVKQTLKHLATVVVIFVPYLLVLVPHLSTLPKLGKQWKLEGFDVSELDY